MTAAAQDAPSKRAQAAARKSDLAKEKSEALADLALIRADVEPLTTKVPSSFGDWGVIRTKAWRVSAVELGRACRKKCPGSQARDRVTTLRLLADTVRSVPTWEITRCAEYLVEHEAKKVKTKGKKR